MVQVFQRFPVLTCYPAQSHCIHSLQSIQSWTFHDLCLISDIKEIFIHSIIHIQLNNFFAKEDESEATIFCDERKFHVNQHTIGIYLVCIYLYYLRYLLSQSCSFLCSHSSSMSTYGHVFTVELHAAMAKLPWKFEQQLFIDLLGEPSPQSWSQGKNILHIAYISNAYQHIKIHSKLSLCQSQLLSCEICQILWFLRFCIFKDLVFEDDLKNEKKGVLLGWNTRG